MAADTFIYGSFSHAKGSVSFSSLENTIVRGTSLRPYMLRRTWNVNASIVGLDQNDIFSQLNGMISAYNVTGVSAGFVGTPFYFDSGLSLGGVRVTKPPSFSNLKGSDAITHLNISFSLQTDEMFGGAGTVIEFKEKTSFSDNGGFPMTVERLPQNAPPIIQIVSAGSWYYGKQQGTLRTAYKRPVPMDPLFPLNLRYSGGAARAQDWENPVLENGAFISQSVSWNYDYISAQPFFSLPNSLG